MGGAVWAGAGSDGSGAGVTEGDWGVGSVDDGALVGGVGDEPATKSAGSTSVG